MTTKKTIYLIRHGETDYNKQGIIQGSGINSNLNENGLLQAYSFYLAYRHIAFNKIYVSQLKRTFQSIEPFLKSGMMIEEVPELNEINWGIMEGVHPDPYNQLIYKQLINDWKDGFLDKAIENGETPLQMFNRQKVGLEKIMQKNDEETILICMHGRALRSFLCLMLEEDLKNMDKFKHSNLCLYILEKQENGKFNLVLENSVEHLW